MSRELEERLAAAEKTIQVLLQRIERDEQLDRVTHGDAARVIAGLESILRLRSQALRESEARYRTLFETSPDMVLTADAAGRITQANARAVEALGDVVADGVRVDELFDDAQAANVLHSVLSGPSGGVLGELTLVDGRRVSLTASQIPAFEGLSQIVLRDISARRALEEELLQSRRLAAVGHLAAGVAHEINNPLAVMQLRLDVLEDQGIPAAVKPTLDVIGRQLDRIARIVKSLQSFAKAPSVQKEEVTARELVEGAVEAAGAAIAGCTLDVDVPEHLPLAVDRLQLEQVLTNLLVNAAHAMEGHGRIEVVARGDGAGQVTFEVTDEGPGIPPEIEADLFTPFVSGRVDGTGLGLAICWAIVEEHGGAILGETLDEGGARFVVRLPTGLPETIPPDTSLPPQPAGEVTVLVVDDEEEILSLLTAFLVAAGHRCIPVGSAEDALIAIADHPEIEVLVTDIHLPGRSGLDLLHELEDRRHPLAERAIVMSGLFHRPEGDTPYLQKPFRRARFLTTVDEVISRR